MASFTYANGDEPGAMGSGFVVYGQPSRSGCSEVDWKLEVLGILEASQIQVQTISLEPWGIVLALLDTSSESEPK